MRLLVVPVIAILSILSGGCANVAEQKQELASKSATFTSFAQMTYAGMAPETPLDITLGKGEQIFEFPEGRKSYYFATALPHSSQPRYVVFQSYRSGVLLNTSSTLIPKFAFLDESKQIITASVPSTIMRSSDFWHGAAYSGRVRLPASAKYMVVYAADQVPNPPTALSGNGTVWPVALAQSGTVQLRLTSQAVALVTDSVIRESTSKAQFFVVSEIDGKSVSNAMRESRQASQGTGAMLNTVDMTREVQVKPLKITLLGSHQTGAPIHAIFSQIAGTFLEVKGIVPFTPEPDGDYLVKGELRKEGSSVWIEERISGRIVTDKVITRGQ